MKSSKLTKGMGHRMFDESDLCSAKMSFFADFCFVGNTQKSVCVVLFVFKPLRHLFACNLNWA